MKLIVILIWPLFLYLTESCLMLFDLRAYEYTSWIHAYVLPSSTISYDQYIATVFSNMLDIEFYTDQKYIEQSLYYDWNNWKF